MSPPLVSFREGVSDVGIPEATTSNGLLTIRATADLFPSTFPVSRDSAENLKHLLLSTRDDRVDEAADEHRQRFSID